MSQEAKYSICSICDIGCQLRTETVNGEVKRVIAHDNPMLAKNICLKGWRRRVSITILTDCARPSSESVSEAQINGRRFPTSRPWMKSPSA